MQILPAGTAIVIYPYINLVWANLETLSNGLIMHSHYIYIYHYGTISA